MSDFNAILIEGLFYEQAGRFFVESEGGVQKSLVDILAPVVGQRVQLALHHVPPHGIDHTQPGAGSCRYPGGVGCPVAHDKHPDRLLSFHMEGVLRGPPWALVRFDGGVQPLPLAGMVGHFGRVGAATIVDVEKMREQLAKTDPTALADMLAAKGVNAAELEAVLERLRKAGQE